MINAIANPTMPEVGERYLGTVVKTTTFGAFVSLMPGRDGLLHISQLRKHRRRQAGRERRGRRQGRRQGPGARSPRSTRAASCRSSRSSTADGDAAAAGGRALDRRRRADVPVELAGRAQRAGSTPHARSPGADGGGLVRRTVLPGGLRVVTEAVPERPLGDRSASGSASAPATRRRRSPAPRTTSSTCCSRAPSARDALDISAAIDAVGGEMNAFTAKEYTCFYARVLDADLPLAVDVVCDMVTSSVIRAARRRRRARRDPRRDRHARRRPGRHGARPVRRRRCSATPRSAVRCSAPSSRSRRSAARAIARLLPAALPAAEHGRRGGRQRRPRRRSCGWSARRSRAAGSTRRRRRARRARAPGGRRAGVRRRPRRATGRPSRPTSCSACPGVARDRRAALRPRRAQRGARRRHVVAAVPGGPREARPGLLGLLATTRSTPTPACSASTPAACRARSTRCSTICRDELAKVAATGITAEELERGKGQLRGSLVLGLEDTGSRMSRHRQGRAGLRRAALASTRCSARIDARHPRRGARVAAERADRRRRRSPSSARSTRTATSRPSP